MFLYVSFKRFGKNKRFGYDKNNYILFLDVNKVFKSKKLRIIDYKIYFFILALIKIDKNIKSSTIEIVIYFLRFHL